MYRQYRRDSLSPAFASIPRGREKSCSGGVRQYPAGVSFPERKPTCRTFAYWPGYSLIGLAVGCKAQTTAPSNLPAQLQRRIEVMIRAQYDVPSDVNLTIGTRQPSQFTGYETLPVILSKGGKTQELSFLISADQKKLVHLSTIDLTKDPATDIDISGRPIRGNPNAKVTVVNFDDLECPFCARMHQELFPATLDRYRNQVRFHLQGRPAHRSASLGDARLRGRQLPGRPKRNRVLDLRRLFARAWR